jgi:hypothetical protein
MMFFEDGRKIFPVPLISVPGRAYSKSMIKEYSFPRPFLIVSLYSFQSSVARRALSRSPGRGMRQKCLFSRQQHGVAGDRNQCSRTLLAGPVGVWNVTGIVPCAFHAQTLEDQYGTES